MKKRLSFVLALVLMLSQLWAPGFAEEETQKYSKENIYAALFEADIEAVRSALDNGYITSTELTQYYLDRIAKYNEPYNCFITICDDALQVAAERDKMLSEGSAEGLLFGVPIVIKDNMDLEGYHTTNGFYKKDSQIAKTNAYVVQRLLDEGAVIIAKANMSTQAQDAKRSVSQAVGETKNAYDVELSAGGSSGGSAVSVSLNFATAGLGTDTNSSVRIPAALAGCIALRPTFGNISVDGIKRLNSTRDVPGAITRTVYDQAIMLDVLTDSAYEYTKNLNGDALQGLRIGVLKELSYSVGSGERAEKNLDPEIQEAFQTAVKQLTYCGAEVVEVSMPKIFNLSTKTFSSGDAVYKDNLYKAFQEMLEKENISAVIFPTYLSAPLRSGKDETGKNWSNVSQKFINNCRVLSPSASIPEITVPIGYHSRGAGIGMEIAAQRGQEQLLLDMAYSYTNAVDCRIAPTGAPNDYIDYYVCSLQEMNIIEQPQEQEEPVDVPDEEVSVETQPEEPTVQNVPVKQEDVSNKKEMNRELYITLWVGISLCAAMFIAVIVLTVILVKKRTARKKEKMYT